jgi:hypothetical protein
LAGERRPLLIMCALLAGFSAAAVTGHAAAASSTAWALSESVITAVTGPTILCQRSHQQF